MQIDIVSLEHQIEVLDSEIEQLEYEHPETCYDMPEYNYLIHERASLDSALSLILENESK
jgi:hypothetical protein